jgi:hypothetical protein
VRKVFEVGREHGRISRHCFMLLGTWRLVMTTIDLIARICLAVWLILMGALQAFDIKFNNRDKIMGVLAIVAGVVFLIAALK